MRGDQTLRVEVRDAVPVGPERRPPPRDRPGGFGLNIVTTLSRRWGWEPTDDGKVVWADVPCCPDDA